MNRIEQLEFELKCQKLVEGTELKWWDVIRYSGAPWGDCSPPAFDGNIANYECALGIIEGKPVFKGNEIYHGHDKVRVVEAANTQFGIADQYRLSWIYIEDCSWNPPKPKTVMVELLRTDVEYYTNETWLPEDEFAAMNERRENACRKALEELPCD